METWFLPNTPCELPAARRVLVLAPHPDDEVFGCGGCIARYAEAGADVRVLVLSDGGGYLDGAERDERVRTRRRSTRSGKSPASAMMTSAGGAAGATLAAAARMTSSSRSRRRRLRRRSEQQAVRAPAVGSAGIVRSAGATICKARRLDGQR